MSDKAAGQKARSPEGREGRLLKQTLRPLES